MRNKQYWLFKTEPAVYSITDLRRDGRTFWDGIRNYQARNFLRDEIRSGDGVLVYHSGGDAPAIVGRAQVTRDGYPDHTQFIPGHEHHDPGATTDSPRWYMVDVLFEDEFSNPLTLAQLKTVPLLSGMSLLQRGNRLSVQPVTPEEWDIVLSMSGAKK